MRRRALSRPPGTRSRHAGPRFRPKTLHNSGGKFQHDGTRMRIRTSIPFFLPMTVLCAQADFRQLIHSGQAALTRADIPGAEKLFLEACGHADDGQRVLRAPDMQASCDHHLAIVAEAKGDYEQAESRLLRALAEWQQAGSAFLPSYAMSLMNLGEVYRELHRSGDAEDYLSRALNVARGVREQFPQIYPQALSRLGGTHAQSDEYAQARVQLTEAIAGFRELEPSQGAEEARALDALGGIDLSEGQGKAAESHLNEAIRLSIAAQGTDHPATASYQADLALAYIQNLRYDRAEPLLNRARSVIEPLPVRNGMRLGTIFAGLSAIARANGRTAVAEDYAHRAVEVLETMPGQYPAAALLARVNLSAVWLSQGRAEDAERILPDAVALERRAAADTCLLADGLRTLAALRALQRSWQEARDLYKEAIEIYQTKLGPNNPMIAPVLREYADVLKRSGGSKADAKKAEARAKAILGYSPRA